MGSEFITEIEYRCFNFHYYNFTSGARHLTNTDINEILSNGHTARGILVYVFCNWLNSKKQEWTVEIRNTGALVLYNKSKKYLFHAVKNEREIEEEIKKYQTLDIPLHFYALLDQFETSQTVKFYEVLA
ncbi:MAG: hypothetical protein IJ934_05820 [Acetobacter sp.]|nr:hypothetical protein [Acetobacter sp.]